MHVFINRVISSASGCPLANKAKGRYESSNSSSGEGGGPSATAASIAAATFGSRLGYGGHSDLMMASPDDSCSSSKKLKSSDMAMDTEMSPEGKVSVCRKLTLKDKTNGFFFLRKTPLAIVDAGLRPAVAAASLSTLTSRASAPTSSRLSSEVTLPRPWLPRLASGCPRSPWRRPICLASSSSSINCSTTLKATETGIISRARSTLTTT
jgi:hypothetical protein